MKKDNIYALAILLLILALSLLKDNITPDYRNTPAANFLSIKVLTTSRLETLFTHTLFWIKALLYSISYIILPTILIHFAFRQAALSKFTLLLLCGITLLLYTSIFIQSASLDHILVSKVNRYLHSPIIILFLWAAFTITKQKPTKNESHT
ncbi:MAG: hypothetical protein KBE91_11570 [Bacteroidia bacterium]|nr:hypothetical protein [Bacteroidia bacterium]MBP9690244.1 hypothetical protein [Bacteroidia bacterium]